MVLEGVWLTGVFDRVVIELGEEGRVVRATVWDFKTDRAATREEALRAGRRYLGQIDLYRKAVARLCGVPLGEVAAGLVFTKIREVLGFAELQSSGSGARGAGN